MRLKNLKTIAFFSVLVVFSTSVILLFTLYRPHLFLGEREEIPNQFTPVLINVIGIFAVHLGVIIASYFSSEYTSSSRKANERHYIAFSLIFLWLIGMLFFIIYSGIRISSGKGTIEAFNEDLDKINMAINFLIAGALVFLFVNHEKTE